MPLPIPRFGGNPDPWVHPVVLCAALAASVLILVLPRRHIIVPLLTASLFIPFDQAFMIGPLHWTMLRGLVLVGWIRVVAAAARPPLRLLSIGLTAIDKALIFWAGISAFNILLLWHSRAALVNQLGALYNVFGIYFLLRFLIRNGEDAERAIRTFTAIAVVVAGIMLLEQARGERVYAALLGVQHPASQLWGRLGALRAVAGFGNPVSAGVFGATLMPLSLALWWKGRRSTGAIGFCAATVIVGASVSSTPVLAYGAAVLALCLWPLRRHLRLLRWGATLALLGLALVMKAPVWALIQRVGIIGGSSGYHRYLLVDQFFRHFWDWWLVGAQNAGEWGYLSYDIANQYVGIGESAGLLPLVLFIAIIVYAFQYLGRARLNNDDRSERRFLWAVGCALLAHVTAFFGLSYFDQLVVCWYASLAIIAAVAVPAARGERQADEESPLSGSVWPGEHAACARSV